MHVLKSWYQTYFSNSDAVILSSVILAFMGIIYGAGYILAPVFASLIIAYLLEAVVVGLTKCKIPYKLSVLLVFITFLSLALLLMFVLLPLLWEQIVKFIKDVPQMMARVEELLSEVPALFPELKISLNTEKLLSAYKQEITSLGQAIVTNSLSYISNLVVVVVYLVLVPLLVYFFLMDKTTITDWTGRFLPTNRPHLRQIWREIKVQIGNYIRGKVIELIIITIVTYITFAILGLQYAALLAIALGLSVFVPIIGGVVVTIPVVIIAFWQWGWTGDFIYTMIAYAVIVTLDANLLVPILLSEAVKIHPVAIIVALLFFGGIWGFWGIFFAIPLAIVVKAVIHSWPKASVT